MPPPSKGRQQDRPGARGTQSLHAGGLRRHRAAADRGLNVRRGDLATRPGARPDGLRGAARLRSHSSASVRFTQSAGSGYSRRFSDPQSKHSQPSAICRGRCDPKLERNSKTWPGITCQTFQAMPSGESKVLAAI
jgi:hypothetical protein